MINKQNEYKQWLIDLKNRIRQSQIKAAIKVNTELLLLYWDLGQDIIARQMESTWGSGFFEQLSKDLRSEFPDMQGFSSTNLKYCKQFYLFYNQNKLIRQQPVGELMPIADAAFRQQHDDELAHHPIFQIPWGHHIQLFSKCKSVKEALFYVQKTIENGWSSLEKWILAMKNKIIGIIK